MNQIKPEVWRFLEVSRPLGDAITSRPAIPELTVRLLAALDADGKRHLIIRLDPEDTTLVDSSSRGVTVVTRELYVVGQTPSQFIDLACWDVNGHGAFDLIGGELAQGLARTDQPPALLCSRVLGKWRRFWGQIPKQVLSLEQQVGLFGELWFLAFWLIPQCGNEQAVTRWRGPFGARHDFEWVGKSVETKASTMSSGRIHRVNGIDQLAPPTNGDLYLFSIRLQSDGGSTNTLNSLVERCRTLLAADPTVIDRWEAALVTAGYSIAHVDEYERLHWRVADEFLYHVTGDFPRLVREHLKNGLPQGVDRVSYDILLDGFSNFVVDQNHLPSILS